jgi:hypothetical protein
MRTPYGDDGLGRMAWWRQASHATARKMHVDRASQWRISESHVGSL